MKSLDQTLIHCPIFITAIKFNLVIVSEPTRQINRKILLMIIDQKNLRFFVVRNHKKSHFRNNICNISNAAHFLFLCCVFLNSSNKKISMFNRFNNVHAEPKQNSLIILIS